MRRLGRIVARAPGPILALWAVLLILALLLAPNARRHLHETDLRIPGSQSAHAAELTRERFGGTFAMAVLLKGPPRIVEREGPAVVQALERVQGVSVLSPWAIGGARVLREPPGEALLSIETSRPFKEVFEETTPAVERTLGRVVSPPLSAELTGQAPLMRAINETSLDSLDRGELIALPILFLMLLVIFRSPLAALVPAIAGLLVTRIGTAAMGFVSQAVDVDALALNMVTMIGLALGVDYSLLVVSRFREELAAGRAVPDAIEQVVARAGRTVLFAGTALATGMLGALLIAPGSLLVSATMGVIVATLMAVLVALLAMPAGLALLGANVNRWQFGGARGESPWVRIAERALRRPGAAAFFVLLPLVLLAAPAIALDTGPPNIANLPSDTPARKAYETFERERGAGWAAPFEVSFTTRGPITTNERLRALERFQQRVSRLDGVEAVLGPAALGDRAAVLRRVTRSALDAATPLARLERGLRRARSGAGALRDGLATGAQGAGALARALDDAVRGSGQLAGGARGAGPRTQQLADGVARTREGARQLARALRRIGPGADTLTRNLGELARSLTAESRGSGRRLVDPLNRAQSQAQTALRALGSVSPAVAADPNVARAREAIAAALIGLGEVGLNLSGTTTTLDADAIAAREIVRGTKRLTGALQRLQRGSGQLEEGIAQTAAGAAELARGVDRLGDGTAALDAGLRTLLDGPDGSSGARALADGLAQAVGATQRLGRGTQAILDGVVRVRQRGDRQQAQLRQSGTSVERAIESGYFVLAAIDGAQPQTRTNVSFATNLDRGGGTARVIVVPAAGPFDPASAAVSAALERETARTAGELDAEGLVGGPAVLLDDFDRATTARFPYLVLVLVVVTFLVLLLLFRSPVLALCAVILNLVTVGAAVGVLVICFGGDSPLLGGPGYLDAIALSGIFAVVFGLSIDYEVFLITRLLEGRALTGSTDGAIRYGLEKTATIITGAALIMAAVFLAFALSPVTNTRQFGIGLTVAVLLDATVVRLILLPALIRLFGERTWYVPPWLDRALPRFSAR
jgi:RND superfamily putative drug exporter